MGDDGSGPYPEWGEGPAFYMHDLNPHRVLGIMLEDKTLSFKLVTYRRPLSETETGWQIDESQTVEFRFDFPQVKRLIEYFQSCMDEAKEPAQS